MIKLRENIYSEARMFVLFGACFGNAISGRNEIRYFQKSNNNIYIYLIVRLIQV